MATMMPPPGDTQDETRSRFFCPLCGSTAETWAITCVDVTFTATCRCPQGHDYEYEWYA